MKAKKAVAGAGVKPTTYLWDTQARYATVSDGLHGALLTLYGVTNTIDDTVEGFDLPEDADLSELSDDVAKLSESLHDLAKKAESMSAVFRQRLEAQEGV